MKIRTELQSVYAEIFGSSYEGHVMHSTDDLDALSRKFCVRVREMGYAIIWDPSMKRIVRS
jgi:hypothetical protein